MKDARTVLCSAGSARDPLSAVVYQLRIDLRGARGGPDMTTTNIANVIRTKLKLSRSIRRWKLIAYVHPERRNELVFYVFFERWQPSRRLDNLALAWLRIVSGLFGMSETLARDEWTPTDKTSRARLWADAAFLGGTIDAAAEAAMLEALAAKATAQVTLSSSMPALAPS